MEITFRRKMLLAGVGLIVLIAILIVVVRQYKEEKESIKIGMAITLTGRPSTFGVHVRNGFILALEQINRSGGIDGRPIELIVKDDKANSAQAQRVDQELLDAGVVAIIGHSLSTPTVASVPALVQLNRC
jgi:branched-chain amino acid transport system substrate-binding protein